MDMITYALLNKKVSSILPGYAYKGGVASTSDLPESGNTTGDLYTVGTDQYVWNGTTWVQVNGQLQEDVDALKSQVDELEETQYDPYIVDTASGDIANFPDGADGIPMKKLVANIEPVQSGSGDPSPDNIRPISGWTEANVYRTGFNLWDEEPLLNRFLQPDGTTYAANGYLCSKNIIPVPPGSFIYYKIPYYNSNTVYVVYYNKDGNVIGSINLVANNEFKVPTNACGVRFGVQYAASAIVEYNHDICINISDPAKNGTYEPYQGLTIPISFPDAAGTVYGGTLDVTSGALTVDRETYTVTGTESWVAWDSNAYYTTTLTGKDGIINTTTKNCISSVLKSATAGDLYSGTQSSGVAVSGVRVYISASDYANRANLVGMQIVYKLATPVTYQLTPTQVTTLLGTNNVWFDCGSTDCTYRADTKLYIEKLTAPTEDDMVANNSIAANTYFMVGNKLYYSTTSIAAGATLTVGTNCQETNLAAALNAINS